MKYRANGSVWVSVEASSHEEAATKIADIVKALNEVYGASVKVSLAEHHQTRKLYLVEDANESR